jgi:hypothetical protein
MAPYWAAFSSTQPQPRQVWAMQVSRLSPLSEWRALPLRDPAQVRNTQLLLAASAIGLASNKLEFRKAELDRCNKSARLSYRMKDGVALPRT